MDPAIWILLPMELLEMILLWVPFSTLIQFGSISKHCYELLWKPTFTTSWLNNHITEVFLVELWRPYQMEILYKFINYIGHTSFLHVTDLENSYFIECMTASIILLSTSCPLPGHKKYYIMNPIIIHFSYIGMIEVGVNGFCTLI